MDNENRQLLKYVGIINLFSLPPSPSTSLAFTYDPKLVLMKSIFMGNFSVDAFKYIIRGFVFLFLDTFKKENNIIIEKIRDLAARATSYDDLIDMQKYINASIKELNQTYDYRYSRLIYV